MGAQPIAEAGDSGVEVAGCESTRARTHLATSLAFASGWKSSNTS